jgi:ribonuclease Z
MVLLPQLRLALDPGRPHRALTPMTTVVLSHGHTDHLVGLSYWASQRQLHSLGPATLLAPAAIADRIRRLLDLHATLEGGQPYPVELVPVVDGDRRRLRRDLELELFATDHWVPTLGTRLTWIKSRLRTDLVGLAEAEIVRLRRAGEPVSEEERVALLAYGADSGPGLLERRADILRAEVLLLECSFFRPADRERAARYGHIHLEDLLAAAPTLGCRHLVLLHASRRHRLAEVEEMLAERLAPRLRCELHHLFVDWE